MVICHLAIHPDEDVIERIGVKSVLRCGTCHDAIDLAILVEVGYIGATAVRPEGIEHHVRGYTGAVALCGIDFHFVFGEGLAVE